MKNSKIFVALLIAALLVVSVALVACNGGYTLTFETNGGTALDPISFKKGQKVTPPVTTKTNFTFDGWYADYDLEVPFEFFDKMPDSDVTVYAKWTAGESAKIVFETNGGSDVETYVGIVGQPTTQPSNPTKTGYTFLGWYSDVNCTQVYVFGSLLTSGTTTLYAKWGTDANYNYVTYHLNGETTEVPVQKNTKATEPSKEADVECIWYTDADYTTVYDFNSTVNDNFHLYGLKYSKGLTFDGNKVTGYNGASANVYLPAKYNGTKITTIGDGAFASNTKIKYVTLPNSLTTIGDAAFYGCEYLVNINITGSVAQIGEFAFANCSRMIATIDLTGVEAVSNSAFANCSWLTTVVFGSKLTAIGDNAFINCSSLTTAALTDSIQSVGDYAFAYSGITTLAIPTSLTHFGTGVVKGAANLSSISGGNSTFTVDSAKGTVVNGSRLVLYVTTAKNADTTDYELPSGVTEVEPYAFYGNATIKNLNVSGANQLGLSSLEGMKALTSLKASKFDSENPYLAYWFGATDTKKNTSSGRYVPDSLKTVEFTAYSSDTVADYAFYGCNGLATVKGLNNIATIGKYAFAYTGLITYEIGASVTSIDSTAFYGAKDMVAITVTDNAKYHGFDGALYEDKTLIYVPEGKASLEIDPTADTIAAGALYRSKIVNLTVRDNIKSIGFGAFENMTRLTSLTLPFIGGSAEKNTYMMYLFGANVSIGEQSDDEPSEYPMSDADKCPPTLRSITIAGTSAVTEIPQFAFAYCTYVTSINCGTDYTSVGYAAFARTGLVSLTVPDSVTTIANYAYFACSDLVNLTIGSGVESIGDWAFGFLPSVETIKFQEGTSDLTIGESAFRAYTYKDSYNIEHATSELSNLKLSNNIVSVGKSAFKYVGYNGMTMYSGYLMEDDTATYTYLNVVFDAENSRLQTIGEEAFFFGGIARVVLPATVTSIGTRAFVNNVMLTSVTVGTSNTNSQLTSIGDRAFNYCDKLTSFVLHKTVSAASDVPTLGSRAFEGTIVKVYVPAASVDIYTSVWGSGSYIVSIQAI